MLHQYGLAQPHYLGLTASCDALVLVLYSIGTPNNFRLPDINAAVSEICDVSRINRTKLSSLVQYTT